MKYEESKIMLKYQTWYAFVWISTIVLYGVGLSSFNTELCFPLDVFFFITIIAAVFLAKVATNVPLQRIEYVREREPIGTVLISLGFLTDWAYQRKIPMLYPYQGFEVGVSENEVVGIPVLHVVLIGCAVYWGMYLGYLFICNPMKKQYLVELCVLIGLFIANLSRGYIVFMLFVPLLCFAAFHSHGVTKTKVSTILAVFLCGLSIVFFISIMGNMRYGYSWYDCAYIERIGRYMNYPWWLSKHFMWFYSYVTSPLANLNLNATMPSNPLDIKGYIFSFLPGVFGYTSGSTTIHYITSYFNAVTGFTTFLRSGGLAGLYFAIAVIFVYYSLVRYVLRRCKALDTFGNAVLCLLIIGFVFYNSLRTAALCYLPIMLVIHSFYMSKQVASGKVVVYPYQENDSYKRTEVNGR